MAATEPVSGRPSDAQLRVTDAGGLSGEDGATVMVVAAEAPQEPALTASFHAMPASHDRTPVRPDADVRRRERLGGLLNFYHREAA